MCHRSGSAAAGRGISILPRSTAVFYRRPDVTYALVADIPPNQVSLAWMANRRLPLIREFVDIATACANPAAAHPPSGPRG